MDWAAFGDFINNIGGVLVAVAGTTVAGIAVVLSHRERTSTYRNHLFEKQVAVLTELADSASQLVRNVLSEVSRRRGEAGIEIIQVDSAGWEALIRLRQRSQVILPNDVNTALARFMDAAYTVVGVQPRGGPVLVPARVDLESTETLVDCLNSLHASIRASLGVDHLTSETLNLFRKSGGSPQA